MKEILINSTSLEVRAAIVEEGELVEFMVERSSTRRLVGDVYLGRVNAILPGIHRHRGTGHGDEGIARPRLRAGCGPAPVARLVAGAGEESGVGRPVGRAATRLNRSKVTGKRSKVTLEVTAPSNLPLTCDL